MPTFPRVAAESVASRGPPRLLRYRTFRRGWPMESPEQPGDLPPDVAARLVSELRPDERLVWFGRPVPQAQAWTFGCMRAIAIVPVVVGLPLLFVFPPAALVFLPVGWMFWMMPRWIRRQAGRTFYLLTDQRAITWEPMFFGGITVQSFTGAGLAQMVRHENADGSGSLVFREDILLDDDGTATRSRGFLNIARVREVEDLVRHTLLDGQP